VDGPDGTGDPVCWLHTLCPECGALPTEDEPECCWRCGTSLAEDPAD
jgi:predicted amidophosphoribosyltransferase